MSKKAFKSQASSARAASGAAGGGFGYDRSPFGKGATVFGGVTASSLSYVYEPPGLTGVSDPNVIVAFKNVQKKDGTTKSKALEDLQNYVQNLEGKSVEEGILEAWIKVYPRTSIDSSRRVRQLAHIFQGRIAALCGKRLAKYMTDVIPSWLAGQQDPDKAVSRAAHESFNHVFASEEKSKNVWRLYHQAIIEYTENVVAKETQNTLSDERTTSQDDAFAKYARVAGCAVTLVYILLEMMSLADLEKSDATLQTLINEEALWKLGINNEAFVRRAIYRLLIVCLEKQDQKLNFSILSTNIVTKGLHISQSGSSLDLIKAILHLTRVHPTVWTTEYQGTGKKSALNRLLNFLRKGSQGGPVEFWAYIPRLLKSVPDEVILVTPTEAITDFEHGNPHHLMPVLDAFRAGVNTKDEPQSNASSAWSAYLDACIFFISEKKRADLSSSLQIYLLPLITQFITLSPEKSEWTIAGLQGQDICIKACDMILQEDQHLFEKEWQNISSKLIESFHTSLPEQSKDYKISQDSIASGTLRWYSIQAALIQRSLSESIMQSICLHGRQEIAAAISILAARNGKPYGVAAALQTAAQMILPFIIKESPVKDTLLDFAENEIPRLMTSPSAIHLIGLLDSVEDHVDVRPAYLRCIQSLESSLNTPGGQNAMCALLSSPGAAKAGLLSITANKTLARVLEDVSKINDDSNLSFLMAALQNPSAPEGLTDEILSILIEGLSIKDSSQASLRGLDVATRQSKSALRSFAAHARGSDLMAKLLFLSEDLDKATSQQVTEMIKETERILATTGDIARQSRPLVQTIRREFQEAGIESLSIESLFGQADRLLQQALSEDLPSMTSELLPKPTDWTRAMSPFITRLPNPSVAVNSPFGLAIAMIRPESSDPETNAPRIISRDQDGRSVLLRILQYVTKLAEATQSLSQATMDQMLTILKYFALSVQLAEENISVTGSMPLWFTDDREMEAEATESIFEAQRLLARFVLTASKSDLIPRLLVQLLQDSKGLSPSSYYNARAYLGLVDNLDETHRRLLPTNDAPIKAIRESPNVFTDMALLMSCTGKDAVMPFNELLSDLTKFHFEKKDTEGQQEGLRKLHLLNCILQKQDEILQEIPQQRLIFFVQHVIREIRMDSFGPAVEIIRSLTVILPAINEIYGSFWGDALDFASTMQQFPLDDVHLPGHHASLKLMSTLSKPRMLEANDDLLDAWIDRKPSIMQSLLILLEKASIMPDETQLPRRTFNELLSRLLAGSKPVFREENETLIPILAAESTILQSTAFSLLHDQIPSKQEQTSLDKALTKDYKAKLPEELLSLILAPPSGSEISESLQNTFHASLRGYLLSWVLVFDHWKNASTILQVDYAKSVTEGAYLTGLLNLAFTVLFSARGKNVDISKLQVEVYAVDVESPLRDIVWLLSHLYLLCLKYLPTQSKAWWRDSTNRQTNIAVEAWTQKHISKLIIASELEHVREWARTQSNGDQPLTIKVSLPAREIIASIPVDEQYMVLAIRLPTSYPLARAEVEGIHRVGVPEKKWISWIRNTQGLLTIASEGGANALVDCLMAWRKNVTATMKGQSECAICYSVVGADRTLPSKVCKTCKNKFHGSCLFRWFSSSNSSSCPLCRNTFTYS